MEHNIQFATKKHTHTHTHTHPHMHKLAVTGLYMMQSEWQSQAVDACSMDFPPSGDFQTKTFQTYK